MVVVTERVGILVEVDQGDSGVWRDMIYVDRDEYLTMSESDIESLKSERYAQYQVNLATAQDAPPAESAAPVEGEPSSLQVLRDQAAQLLADLDTALAQEQAAQETPPQEA